jgi:putative tricarboxylic transport membrane protein
MAARRSGGEGEASAMKSDPRVWLDARVVLPLVLMAATTVYLIGALNITTPYEDEGVGAEFFPFILSAIMYAALLVVLWKGIREARGAPLPELHLADPIKVVVLTTLFILLFQPLGYFLATVIYVYALFFVFNFGTRNHLVRIATAVAVAIAFYLLFETAFQVRLPKLWGLI